MITQKYSTPLHLLARSGHLEATQTFVERGAPVYNANNHGCTPLVLAAGYGYLDLFRYFTLISADINNRDADGNTALHSAAISVNVVFPKILLDKGITVDLTTAEVSTPLHLPIVGRHLEETKTVVESGNILNKAN